MLRLCIFLVRLRARVKNRIHGSPNIQSCESTAGQWLKIAIPRYLRGPLSALHPLPIMTVGGTAATVVFAGLTSPGLFQVNIVVPKLAPGVYPIMVTWGGVTSPVGVQIPVSQ